MVCWQRKYAPILAASLLLAATSWAQTPAAPAPTPLAMDEAIRAAAERGPLGATVRNAYLDFLYRTQALESAQASASLAEQLVQDNTARAARGDLPPIDVVAARAELATRNAISVREQNNQRVAELALKRLIVNGTSDPLWSAAITPAASAPFEPAIAELNTSASRAEVVVRTTATPDTVAAALAVQGAVQSTRASQAIRDDARATLASRRSALEQGSASNYQVIEAQRALSRAESDVLESVLSYRKALTEFERLQGVR